MANRKIRVDELIRRELSLILHTDYRQDTVLITVSSVDVSPDLRNARVFYSVLGDTAEVAKAEAFFRRRASDLRQKVGRAVTLKYLPFFSFLYDESLARGSEILNLIDDVTHENQEPNE